eukprot:1042167-Amphidinium_carterae.1
MPTTLSLLQHFGYVRWAYILYHERMSQSIRCRMRNGLVTLVLSSLHLANCRHRARPVCAIGEEVLALYTGHRDLGRGNEPCHSAVEECWWDATVAAGPNGVGIYTVDWANGHLEHRSVHNFWGTSWERQIPGTCFVRGARRPTKLVGRLEQIVFGSQPHPRAPHQMLD